MKLPWERAPQAPDLECPECGWLDGVPVRVIERVRIENGIAVSRAVGKVYRCAKCTTEYVSGPSGNYRPLGPRGNSTAPTATERKRDDDGAGLRDRDQQWDRVRS